MKRLASAFAMLWATLFIYSAGPAASAPAAQPARPARSHMIVAAEPDAAEAGRTMLRRGGSAVDAAIAAQMVLTLEEPQSSGIGGGSYLLVADGSALKAYDGREMAPASASPRMFLDKDGNPRRGRDVVPGMVRYSERGDAYVHELQTIMRQNHLDAVDDAMLLSMHIIRLEPGD